MAIKHTTGFSYEPFRSRTGAFGAFGLRDNGNRSFLPAHGDSCDRTICTSPAPTPPRKTEGLAIAESLSGANLATPQIIGSFRNLLRCDGLERVATALFYQNELIAQLEVASGVPGQVQFRCRDIALLALKAGATELVVAHNHPSGDPRPSEQDIFATRKLRKILIELDINLVDHLIFTKKRMHSMKLGNTSWISNT